MKYVILKSNDVNRLEHLVNKYIKDGFKPLGGVFINNDTFYQAMIKEE